MKFRAQIILCCIALTCFSCLIMNRGYADLTKWEKMAQEVDTWTDGLGMPIDKEIKELVIALNVVGISTYQSCEGHLDWGLAYPWISFSFRNSETERLTEKRFDLGEKISNEEKILKEKFPNITIHERIKQEDGKTLKDLYMNFHAVDAELTRNIRSQIKPLFDLVSAFNNSRRNPYDQLLYVEVLGLSGSTTLQCIGSDWQCLCTEEDKNNNLTKYRQIMKEFAEFIWHSDQKNNV